MNNTTTIPSGKDIQRKWFVLDAAGKTLGRLSTQAASILAGKNNVLYTPYIDMGDHVIVVNCEKIVLTGLKADSKLYRRYTGFPGGLREDGPADGDQAEGLQGAASSAPGAAASGPGVSCLERAQATPCERARRLTRFRMKQWAVALKSGPTKTARQTA